MVVSPLSSLSPSFSPSHHVSAPPARRKVSNIIADFPSLVQDLFCGLHSTQWLSLQSVIRMTKLLTTQASR